MDLSIVIVNWNSAELVKKCLASIYENIGGIDHEIIVIDNGSFDACGNMVKEQYPAVLFLQSHNNQGFAKANNLGAAGARGDALLFLNPDTEVVGNAVSQMLSVLKTLPQAGIVGCKLLNTDLTVQTSCVQPFPTILNQALDLTIMQRLFPAVSLWRTSASFNNAEDPVEVQAISGACMMVKSAAFRDVNGFSPEYFMYTEDIDLCFKAQQAGYKNYYINTASVIHHGGGSSFHRQENSYANVQMRASIAKFLKKTRGDLYASMYRSTMFLAGVVRLIAASLLLLPCIVTGQYVRCKAVLLKWASITLWAIGFAKWAR
jgi:GT2 family glycosyltransferase